MEGEKLINIGRQIGSANGWVTGYQYAADAALEMVNEEIQKWMDCEEFTGEHKGKLEALEDLKSQFKRVLFSPTMPQD